MKNLFTKETLISIAITVIAVIVAGFVVNNLPEKIRSKVS